MPGLMASSTAQPSAQFPSSRRPALPLPARSLLPRSSRGACISLTAGSSKVILLPHRSLTYICKAPLAKPATEFLGSGRSAWTSVGAQFGPTVEKTYLVS